MAFDDQDRVNHTDTENRSEEHPTAEGTQQKNEEAESSGLYRMTREDLKNSTLYTEPVHSSTAASENVGGTGRSAGHTGSSYATGNDYSYYHAPQNSSNVMVVMAATEDITEAERVSMAVRRRNIHIKKADLVRQWLRQLVWVLSSGWQHQPLCLV